MWKATSKRGKWRKDNEKPLADKAVLPGKTSSGKSFCLAILSSKVRMQNS